MSSKRSFDVFKREVARKAKQLERCQRKEQRRRDKKKVIAYEPQA